VGAVSPAAAPEAVGAARRVVPPTVRVPRPVDSAAFRRALLEWDAVQGRRLPTLADEGPWAVMVLEIASQQTQILRSIEAARRFTARFPSPAALAEATPADAIREWAGLGYYRRAVHLWKAAGVIVQRHDGEVPRTVDELLSLPGLGPYTARAVAVHAFGAPVAPLDTNVRRVFGRLLGLEVPDPALQPLADELVGSDDPSAVVRATMDLAALVCRRAPECAACPLAVACASAFAADRPARRAAEGPATPFVGTRRWLRGRLIERLSEPESGRGVAVAELAALFPDLDVGDAIRGLVADGLVEMDGDELRLPGAGGGEGPGTSGGRDNVHGAALR
jgi:A/G-specific adenine glycosylase